MESWDMHFSGDPWYNEAFYEIVYGVTFASRKGYNMPQQRLTTHA